MARAYFPYPPPMSYAKWQKCMRRCRRLSRACLLARAISKSTDLVVRNTEQLGDIEANFPKVFFTPAHEQNLRQMMAETRALIAVYSDPARVDGAFHRQLAQVIGDIQDLTARVQGGAEHLRPSTAALAQTPWGVGDEEIPNSADDRTRGAV